MPAAVRGLLESLARRWRPPTGGDRRSISARSGRLSALATSRIVGPAAAVDGERDSDAPATVAHGEVLCKGHDVAGGRAPPAIDRLEGIANCRDRVAPALAGDTAGEQAAQHDRLRCGGVLVLIEQHDTECVPHRAGDLRDFGGQAGQQWPSGRRTPPVRAAFQRLVVDVPDWPTRAAPDRR